MSARLCGIDRMAHVLNLAASVYYAHALIVNADVPHFDALDPLEKHRYVAIAESALSAAKQDASLFDVAVALSRAEGARVVGRITPSGDPTPLPIDSRD